MSNLAIWENVSKANGDMWDKRTHIEISVAAMHFK